MKSIDFLINFISYGGILALAFYDAYTYWTRGGRDHVSLKGEMTGMGMLGTFCGIFLGLVNFNVNDIAGSVPALLSGLKTAFGTSIAGLFCSTALTVIQAVKPVAFRKTGDPIADTLVRVFQEFEPLMGDLRDATKKNSEELVSMRLSMETTMETLKDGVTTQIIKALESVIADFNTNLKEQFGENFKRLNEACFKLVEWQKDYIPTVESAERALNGAISTFNLLQAQTQAMIGAHHELMAALQSVGEDARGLAGASKEMGAATKELEVTIARADKLMDLVKDKIELTANVFGHTMDGFERKTQEVAHATHERSERLFTQLRGKIDETGTVLGHAMDGFERKTQEVAHATHDRSERLIALLRERIDETSKAFGQSLDEMETKVGEVTTRIGEDLEQLSSIGEAVESAAAGAERAAGAASGAAKSAEEASHTAAKTVVITRGEMEKAHRNLEQALVALTNGFSHAYRDYLDGLRKLADQ
jgi:methyl-accepting chemotaxis protein